MRTRKRTKLVHEGKYVAEVDVDLIEIDEGWSPYLSLEDAFKLRKVTFKGRGLPPGVSGASWDHIRELTYEGKGG